MSNNKGKKTDSNVKDLINAGASIAGGALGGAVGLLVGGPAGAIAGGAAGSAAGEALKHIGDEISRRTLAPRETMRVGGVLALAAAKIKTRLDADEKVRGDHFFESDSTNRSNAEEITESVLSKAQRESEEKKLPYMANLISNITFDSSISVQFAQQISKIVESLTFRQLCLLKIAAYASKYPVRSTSYDDQSSFSKELRQVLYELMDLFNRGLIHNGPIHALSIKELVPANMGVHGVGADLFNLLNLNEIPDAELAPLIALLRPA